MASAIVGAMQAGQEKVSGEGVLAWTGSRAIPENLSVCLGGVEIEVRERERETSYDLGYS